MNCRRTESLLSALIDGELAGADAIRIREHLKECASCRDDYESLLETKRIIGSLTLVEPCADYEARLIRVLSSCEANPSRIGAIKAWWSIGGERLRLRSAGAFAAAGLLILAVSIRMTMMGGVRDDRLQTATALPAETLPAIRDRDIGFAHETFERPQPVIYSESLDPKDSSRAPDVAPLRSWDPYEAVSSTP